MFLWEKQDSYNYSGKVKVICIHMLIIKFLKSKQNYRKQFFDLGMCYFVVVVWFGTVYFLTLELFLWSMGTGITKTEFQNQVLPGN